MQDNTFYNSELAGKIIWHINHSEIDATSKVVKATANNFNNLHYKSFFVTPFSKVFDESLNGKVIKKSIHFKIYLLKILRILLTKRKYSFYNLIEVFSIFPTNYLLKKFDKPDIIILYWVSGLITSKDIYKLHQKTGAKLIWYPMDMAVVTAGCHYSWGCENYKNSCSNCPAFNNSITASFAKFNLKKRNQYISKLNFHLISSSLEMDGQINASKLWQNNSTLKKIYVPINEKLYNPLDREKIKQNFGVDNNKVIIGCGLKKSSDFERKGFKYFLEALTILNQKYPQTNKSIQVLLIGEYVEDFIKKIPFSVIHAGYLNTEIQLAEFYNAVDLFISTSIQDSGPIMINQSLMCGTPTLSFNIGVAPDFVVNGVTGYVVEKMNSEAMADSINSFVAKHKIEKEKMRENCRDLAIEKFSSKTMQDGLLHLVSELNL